MAAALVAVLLVGTLLALPGYRKRLRSACDQTRLLSHRFDVSLDTIDTFHWPDAYPVIKTVHDETFDDAVILISDRAEDGRLASVSWTSFFLYPRRVYQLEDVNRLPGNTPDFTLVTAGFPAFIPDSLRSETVSLYPLSPRGVAYAREHWRRAP